MKTGWDFLVCHESCHIPDAHAGGRWRPDGTDRFAPAPEVWL